MNTRTSARKPFLFYNEDYYHPKRKVYFPSYNKYLLFSDYDKYATNKTQSKTLLKQFFDYCLPTKFTRHKNRVEKLIYLMKPVLQKLDSAVLDKIHNVNWIDVPERLPMGDKEHVVLYDWLVKSTNTTNVADHLAYFMREIMKRASTSRVHYRNYYQLFRRCILTLLCIDKAKFMTCVRLVLRTCLPVKQKGVINAKYKLIIATILHFFITDNLKFLLDDVGLLVQLRRLLAKHHMHITNEWIDEFCESVAEEFDIKLHQKLLLTNMMNVDNNLVYSSLANIHEVVKWHEKQTKKRTIPSYLCYNQIFDTTKIPYCSYKYSGWDEQQRYRRTGKFNENLTYLHVNKDNTKVLKAVVSRKRSSF
ncbi:P43-like protein [Erinnyis ello granulovirus]|uniref:p43-like protein n=1 Tax=Erinnyis ello granulovirus TaxID=307444 RepID=A0A097DAT5_9BBAC|nr:P43-like protein [Erinnyis ello granulovirus]AIS92103.1 P43-like protein [Erinnyis ello granulovirus]ARX71444.1 p43-like protein [Erinnyis ello granulovirus]ARX71574.1 p43-like protein [Erinnyis ello granulovirus]ARX71704.1 p43-like protein [Erinnyis ello granulovirus]ARX71834.1 p43-like protein [Erinnyis ello granulovirus]